MKRNFRIVTFGYIIILGIALGASLFAGAIVAPVIFNSADLFAEPLLSHYQEGVIMTENFRRLIYIVDTAIISIVLYEGYKYKMFERDSITTLATFIAVTSGLFFGYYYMPDILNMQLAGEIMTQSDTFAAVHQASEIDFKVFTVALLVIIIRNMQKACK